MPSNKDLKATALELGDELNISLDLTGMHNNDLAILVSDLRAKQRDAELDTQADKSPPDPPVVKDESPPDPPVVKDEPPPDPPVVKDEPSPDPPVVKDEPSPDPPVVKDESSPDPPVVKDESSPDPPVVKDKDEIVRYFIAEGKSITCKKGVKSDGDEIFPEWIVGGQDSLDRLIKRGYVIKT